MEESKEGFAGAGRGTPMKKYAVTFTVFYDYTILAESAAEAKMTATREFAADNPQTWYDELTIEEVEE